MNIDEFVTVAFRTNAGRPQVVTEPVDDIYEIVLTASDGARLVFVAVTEEAAAERICGHVQRMVNAIWAQHGGNVEAGV